MWNWIDKGCGNMILSKPNFFYCIPLIVWASNLSKKKRSCNETKHLNRRMLHSELLTLAALSGNLFQMIQVRKNRSNWSKIKFVWNSFSTTNAQHFFHLLYELLIHSFTYHFEVWTTPYRITDFRMID